MTAAAAPVRSSEHERSLKRYLPILHWLPTYQRSWLRFDLIAGLTILALLIPEGMAYAELAGQAAVDEHDLPSLATDSLTAVSHGLQAKCQGATRSTNWG